jgi:hypothetical protein
MVDSSPEDSAMTSHLRTTIRIAAGATLAACCCTAAAAQTQAPQTQAPQTQAVQAQAAKDQSVPATLGDSDLISIDANTFKIVRGKPNGDIAEEIEKLGARELRAGALVLRNESKLYVADAPIAVDPPAGQGDNAVEVFEEHSNRVHIEYVPPKNPKHQMMYDMLQERDALERLQELFSPFRLPLDVTIRTVGCDGVSNAWYQREGRNPLITLCYEYLQEIMDKTPMGSLPFGLTPHDVMLGQFMYAALHEFGHASFDLYDVPVFGREEDAADQFATFLMLRFKHERARNLIAGATFSFKELVKDYKENANLTVPLRSFSSNHGSPEERYYNLLCITYGSDPKEFAQIVQEHYLPESRASKCQYEFQILRYAFRHEINPHIDMQMAQSVLNMDWISRPGPRPRAQ